MAAPKGLPADIRAALVKAVGQAANDPEFKAKAAQIYAPLRYLPPDQYAEVLKEAEAQFRLLWKEVPWTDK
jgi:tripartite-type tricarboxylate transporter receptor subunit TctC